MIVLYKDHTFERDDSFQITASSLKKIAYLLIDTSSEPCEYPKNYIMIDPNQIPEFTSARVVYQMIFVNEYDGELAEVPTPKVETTTSSISDVINLINCIDRLNCVNEYITNDQWMDARVMIFMAYFSVILYQDEKKVYKEEYSSPINGLKKYSVGNIIKIFQRLYDADIIKRLYKNKEFLFLYEDKRWQIENTDMRYQLMGIPLMGSKTITFLSPREYVALMDIKKFGYTYSIQEVDDPQRRYIEKYIKEGLYDDLASVVEHDFILVSSKTYLQGEGYRFLLLDLMSHIGYCIRLTNFLYDQLYLGDDYGDITINSIISFIFYYRSNKKEKEIYVNEDAPIPLDQFLQLL